MELTELENIPSFLKERKQWVLWKGSKIPYQPNNQKAKTNDKSTLSTFEACKKALQNGGFDGLGFVFSEGDGLTGIDIDKCYDDEGQLKPWAKDIVTHFDGAYIEKSPSGKGLHIWCLGIPIKTGRKKWKDVNTNELVGIEVYNYTSPRYFTVTGQKVEF